MKKTGILILLFTAALALVGCGGDRNGAFGDKIVEWYELSEDAKYENGAVEVNFWHRSGEANQQIIQKWIGEFNELYPNITVIETKVGNNYDELSDAIALAIPAGDQPDIAESYPDHVARYGKAALALNNFVTNPNIGYSQTEIDDFLTGLWEEGTSYDGQGTMMSLPFTKSSEALFYNEGYFNKHGYEVPKTWDEVFALAETIKEKEPDSYPFGYDSTDNLFITGSEQWDAPYTGYNKKTGRGEVLFNNDKSKDMISYFKDKVDRGLMLTRSLNGNAYTSDIMKTNEKLYMFVGSTGGARYSIEGAKDEVFKAGYRVGVAPVPVKSLDNRKQIQQGPNINLFNSKDEQKMIASWLFAKFMLEAERTAEFALQSGYAPVRHSAYETDVWKNWEANIEENPINATKAGQKVIRDAILMFKENEEVFFTSAVFNLSSKTRTEAGALTNKIMAYNAKNAEGVVDLKALRAYIDREYKSSYDFIIT